MLVAHAEAVVVGSKLREREVRHGKGDHRRRVRLTPECARAIAAWERERGRAREREAIALGGEEPADPLFGTLGRRRGSGGGYIDPGRVCTHTLVDGVINRLGGRAGVPEARRSSATLTSCVIRSSRAPGRGSACRWGL